MYHVWLHGVSRTYLAENMFSKPFDLKKKEIIHFSQEIYVTI